MRYDCRLLFWTDWASANASIRRIGMDANHLDFPDTKIVSLKLGWPNGLTIDYYTDRIWWADAHLDLIE
jgi:low density lipoprotein-related protein 2